MKRAAAIIGPTPSFVRWTIRQACPFRQLDDSNQPYEAFRQLRNLREVSVAAIEERIHAGFCLHATENQDAASTRGFPIDEVMAFFGTPDSVHKTCDTCPANAAKYRTGGHTKIQWAGCYGWMRSQFHSTDLVSAINELPEMLTQNMPTASDNWHRIWQVQKWDDANLPELKTIFESLPEEAINQYSDLADLKDAVHASDTGKLVLETELVPSGNSDGIKWTLAAHCSNCKFESTSAQKVCEQCGQVSTWVPASSRKVLGLRPYMVLQNIIGLEGTQELLNKMREETKSDSVSESD